MPTGLPTSNPKITASAKGSRRLEKWISTPGVGQRKHGHDGEGNPGCSVPSRYSSGEMVSRGPLEAAYFFRPLRLRSPSPAPDEFHRALQDPRETLLADIGPCRGHQPQNDSRNRGVDPRLVKGQPDQNAEHNVDPVVSDSELGASVNHA